MRSMANVVSIILLLTFASGCRPAQSSKQKSFVGLSARVAGGGAPSFKAVADWFQSATQAPGDAGDEVLRLTPPNMRDGLFAYAAQQMTRIKEFQTAEKDPGKLKVLLEKEVDDLVEIILALADPSFRPDQAEDIFAKLLAQPGMRTLVDQSAVMALGKIYKTDAATLKRELPIERKNYLKALTDLYVDERHGSKPELVSDLKRNCAWLTNFVKKVGRTIDSKFQCAADQTVLASGAAPRFYRLFSGMMRAQDNLVSWRRANPGRNLHAVDLASAPRTSMSKSGGFHLDDETENNSDGSGDSLSQSQSESDASESCLPGFNYVNGGCETTEYKAEESLPQDWHEDGKNRSDSDSSERPWTKWLKDSNESQHQVPKDYCNSVSGNLLAMIGCERNTPIPLNQGPGFNPGPTTTNLPPKAAFVAAFKEKASSGSNTLFVDKFGSPVLNQGAVPSCTAYTATQSGIAAKQPEQPGWTYDPETQWANQGQSTSYDMAVSTAEKHGVFSKARNIPKTQAAMKMALDNGYPLYTACGTNETWQSLYGVDSLSASLSCDPQGDFGHAFTLVGYTKEGWVVKNSWGSGWGYKGYGVLRFGYESNLTVLYAIDGGGK